MYIHKASRLRAHARCVKSRCHDLDVACDKREGGHEVLWRKKGAPRNVRNEWRRATGEGCNGWREGPNEISVGHGEAPNDHRRSRSQLPEISCFLVNWTPSSKSLPSTALVRLSVLHEAFGLLCYISRASLIDPLR